MTWVIGRPVPFGYSVGLSDIRVTLSDGNELDCLQKVHAVGPNIAAAFAGSVAIGFAMIDRMRQYLRLPRPGLGWDPAVVVSNIPAVSLEVFRGFEREEKALGCGLLLFSVHPSKNNGDSPCALSFVHKLESPAFEVTCSGPTEVTCIGSGAAVAEYAEALRRLNDAPHKIHALERHGTAGSTLGLLLSIETAIQDRPAAGISPHLHICVVRREGVSIQPNDKTVYSDPIQEFRMPRVATTYDELLQTLNAKGASSRSVAC
jgi:hypothetical protein